MTSTSSTTDGAAGSPAERLPERIAVGRIVRARGVRGEVVVVSLSDVPERFAAGGRMELVTGSDSREPLVVREAKELKPGLLAVQFESIDGRDAAERLRGGRLEVERAVVPRAPEGEYWVFELLGCRAFDERAGELGEVVDVVDAGAGPLLVVALADGRSVPLPFVERFLVRVDRSARRIDWRLPEGLIEACASRS